MPPHHLLRGKTLESSFFFLLYFYKVIPTIMVLIEVSSVMMLTSSQTSSSWMLSVLSNTTVSGRDVPSVLTSLRESGRHTKERKWWMRIGGWVNLDSTFFDLFRFDWLNLNRICWSLAEGKTHLASWCDSEEARSRSKSPRLEKIHVTTSLQS